MAYFNNTQLQRTQLMPRAPNLSPEMCLPPGGYNKLSDNEMGSLEIGRTVQLYASQPISSSPFTPSAATFFNPNSKRIEMGSTTLTSKGERWWLVMVNAVELIRTSAEINLSRVSSDRILTPTTPRYSVLQGMVSWMDGSASSHLVKFDIGGGVTFKVFGRNVQIFVLAPENTQIINSAADPDVTLTGITLNNIVSAKIAPVTISPNNLDILKFTWNKGVTARAVDFIEIPPGARKVRILNASVGVVTSAMNFWMSDNPTDGKSMGIIDFVTTNSSELVEIPVGATHICTGATNESDRCFSFIFTIDP